MKKQYYAIVALTVFVFAGCAAQETTVERLSGRITDLSKSLEETNSKVEELDNKFRLLREKIEAGNERLEELSAQEISPPKGLKVIRLGEEGATPPETRAPGPEKPEALYERGQNLFMEGRYEDARGVFNELVNLYPTHVLSDNALYWMGESYYSEKNFLDALHVFKDVVKKYPRGNKAPDALLKAGFSYLELNKRDDAWAAFRELIKHYPGTEAALKAEKRLKGL
ncbi:MAG: hypothetical protein BMS9Abin23_0837 [Thermodesulfobacteriota bacterium]|nr:MAG: hypothetical protein BMS9Abin23_0837 [Thermodesulfobacteriota bacterium]